ncbi:toll/interleukin-1 receptor domain-containing protein [Nocardiopsis sp. MG754419]|uniref:toll/interleukin-1 receptor domain-containing protein n=1 Tax=Nocardiopsis sp. MG754419 TaxID=2259865 RepID=UPI001BA783D8|nr:toll/interleukin-1 receptor domain-containing protein [Nocardiopsis sp. MG754419]MBR8743343.1 TIR domain-containing protein [Nocardiopsis sp. MG754419]
MNSCFVNYRTGDGEHVATLIDRELSRHFGEEEVFRASKSIPSGADFERELRRAAGDCEVLLAVIGPGWVHAEVDGGRALDDPRDWIRQEIVTAFASGATVIPVLVENTPRIKAADLPDDLVPLARCQYRRYRHRTNESDIAELVEAVEIASAELEKKAARRAELAAEPEAESPNTGNTMRDVHGYAVQAREHTVNGVAGVGGDVGTIITGSTGTVNSGTVHNGSAPDGTVHNGTGDINQNSPTHHGTGDQIIGDRERRRGR